MAGMLEVSEAVMHAARSPRIPPAGREIYAYWLPYRIAMRATPDRTHLH
jgi:hypothetical protein